MLNIKINKSKLFKINPENSLYYRYEIKLQWYNLYIYCINFYNYYYT